MKAAVLTLLLLISSLCWPSDFDLGRSVAVHPAQKGGPKKSDVVFSTRFKRDDAISAMSSFSATRVEWMYASPKEADFIREVRSAAGWVGGTLNANVKTHNDEGVARDLDGKLLVAPWMQIWGTKWVTTTNPQTRKALFDWAKSYIDSGVDSLQFDDPLLQLHSAYWGGGDFSQTTVEGFRQYLAGRVDPGTLAALGIKDVESFNLKAFLKVRYGIGTAAQYAEQYKNLPITPLWLAYLRETVKDFFVELRQYLDSNAGRHVPLSMNLAELARPTEASLQFFLAQIADYAVAELGSTDPVEIQVRAATMRALGLGWVPTFAPANVAAGRSAIALVYGLGGSPLVPWDVYVNKGEDGKPTRYFGKVEDFADLYRFVRSNSDLFDNWESTATVGILVPVDKFREAETLRLIGRLSAARVQFAFILSGGSDPRFGVPMLEWSRFKAILSVNPASDFSSLTLTALSESKQALMNGTAMSEKELQQMSPVLDGGLSSSLRLIVRGSLESSHSNELLVHVLGAGIGRESAVNSCAAEFGLKSEFLSGRVPTAATWYSPGKPPRNLALKRTAAGSLVGLPDCGEWGIVRFSLAKP